MKKIIAVLCVAGSFVACNDPKTPDATVEKKDSTVKTETPVAAPDSSSKMAAATTNAVIETPKFADADVQKFADEYTAFIKEASSAAGDPAKTAEYTKKAQEWAAKMAPIAQKLAAKPEEMKKWSDYMQKIAANMTSQTK